MGFLMCVHHIFLGCVANKNLSPGLFCRKIVNLKAAASGKVKKFKKAFVDNWKNPDCGLTSTTGEVKKR
jgi:hypothetical protein